MKKSAFIFSLLFFLALTSIAYAQPAPVDFKWNIRGDSWEGITFKVLPSWQISKGIDTLVISDKTASFIALIMLRRFDEYPSVEQLRAKIDSCEYDYIYKTLDTVPVTPLDNENEGVGFYFVKRFMNEDMAKPAKGEYAFVVRAICQMEILYLDVLVLTNDANGPDFKQLVTMLKTYSTEFGK